MTEREGVDVHVYVHAPAATDPSLGVAPATVETAELLARVAALETRVADQDQALDVLAHRLFVALGGDIRRKLRGRNDFAGLDAVDAAAVMRSPAAYEPGHLERAS